MLKLSSSSRWFYAESCGDDATIVVIGATPDSVGFTTLYGALETVCGVGTGMA